MLGLTAADLDDGETDIWPVNLTATNVFVAMTTQWQHGFGGPTGLKYESLPVVFRMIGIPRKEWTDTFECLRLMEAEAMRVMQETK